MEAPEKQENEYMTAQDALDKLKESGIEVTLATLLAWVHKHHLGFQPGGPNAKWYINCERFERFVTNKLQQVEG